MQPDPNVTVPSVGIVNSEGGTFCGRSLGDPPDRDQSHSLSAHVHQSFRGS